MVAFNLVTDNKVNVSTPVRHFMQDGLVTALAFQTMHVPTIESAFRFVRVTMLVTIRRRILVRRTTGVYVAVVFKFGSARLTQTGYASDRMGLR
jgi:hypothetical protein